MPPQRVPSDEKKPDLLLYSQLYPPFIGGSAVLFENIYSRMNHDVAVITDRMAESRDSIERRGSLSIRRHRLATAQWGVLHPEAFLHHCRAAWILRATGQAPRAIVHCGRALPEGFQALLATGGTRRQYVCWTHGEELAYARTSRELTFLLRHVHRQAAAILANSHHTASMLTAGGVHAPKIHIVHPGVDAARFAPSVDGSSLRERLTKPGEVLLLSIGRLQRRKGHDTVIQALSACRDFSPRLVYVVVGDGEERPHLQRLAGRLGVGERVRFEGEVPAATLPAYYAACDVFVMPNRVDGVDIEGFGIVFLEAAAVGRPTIGGRSGGVPEAIEEGRTGLLVSGTDVEELAAAIRRLASSKELRQRMGEAGRARVVGQFNWERAANDVMRLHQALLERATGTRQEQSSR